MQLAKIEKESFFINQVLHNRNNVASVSLRSALISYFETYEAIKTSFHSIINTENELEHYGIDYIEKCYQSITYFHHFVELILKDILANVHPLLAIDASKKHAIFFDLIKGNEVQESEFDGLNLLSFSDVLNRITTLIENGKLDAVKYGFIKDKKDFLGKLNTLRNRFAHRGALVLKYKSLDYFFCLHALPFLKSVFLLPEYNSPQIWKYQILNCGIDPIEELIDLYSSCQKKYNPEKTALLKQLANASYKNPLYMFAKSKNNDPNSIFDFHLQQYNKEDINRAVAISKYVVENDNILAIEDCPVCGAKTLLLFSDWNDEVDDKGNEIMASEYVYKIQCFCCSFNLRNDVKGIGNMNLPIKNFWVSK